MYDFNCLNESNVNNACRGCLKMSDKVRTMTTDEEKAYRLFVKESNLISNLCVCTFCGHYLKKLGKFVLQCHEANTIIKHFLNKDTKPQVYFSSLSSHCLTVTPPQTLDIVEKDIGPGPLFEDDTTFDDEDLPLVMLKKEEPSLEEEKGSKKKKKVRKREAKVEVIEKSSLCVKTEDLHPIEKQPTDETKVKCKRKAKKELREGFSSRMVQETEEYVVIKLTTEQVLQEMEERAKSEEYQRTLFKCHHCVKGFNFEDVLQTHMEKHSLENGSLRCSICTQYCPTAVSLRGHMKSHTTRYKCKVCGCVRQARQHLLEHHATAHTRGALRYSCRHCAFSTTKRTSMQRHVKSHRPAERHACHQCGKLFKSLETLRVHTMRHDKSSRLQCDTCGRVFIYPSLLHRHVQSVHVRKDYYCVECDREFKSRENLRLHFKKAKKHRDSSSYQHSCPQCPERFSSASSLSAHAAAHAPRPRTRAKHRDDGCGVCDRTFTRKNVLEAHVRVHSPGLHDTQCKKLEDSMPEECQPPLVES